METRELICIGCPLGCPLTVRIDGEKVEVSGNTCSQRSVKPHPDCNLQRTCKRRRAFHGFCKDQGGYSQGKDF